MASSSQGYHEPLEALSNETRDLHRALVSLQEELEAADWYRQRADACGDGELREVLLHNMREEIEHASMILEWLRRRNPVFEDHLKTYLFTDVPITEVEEAQSGSLLAEDKNITPQSGEADQAAGPKLTVGSLIGS